MRVVAVQFDIAWEDPAANRTRVEALLDASPPGAGSLVLLPEMADIGFSMDPTAALASPSLPWAQGLATRHGAWICAGIVLPEADAAALGACAAADRRGPANAAVMIRPDGTVAATYRKIHPFVHGGEGSAYPAGDSLRLARIGGLTVCPLICYDLRFPELWRLAARAGADCFLIGASWPSVRQAHWRALAIARAIENQAFVVACTRSGSDPKHRYAGGSIAVDPSGSILGELGPEEGLLAVELSSGAAAAVRDSLPFLRDIHPEFLGTIPVIRNDEH